MNIIVKKLSYGDAELDRGLAIRKTVFVEEQHCPQELEYENDEVSTHFLAVYNGEPCGAARWRSTEKGHKLERFAVLPNFRGKGVGGELVKAVLADLPANASHIYLNAQVSALDFYRQLGFTPVGERFDEAGIMHQQMIFSGHNQKSVQQAS